MSEKTIVHLLRHGEVHNPEGVLYGRLDGFHLSDLGRAMAERIGESLGGRDIVHLRTSPLERAQGTIAPLAAARGLTPMLDPRVIDPELGWRLAFGIGGALSASVLLLRQFIPESPRWLMTHGRPEEAERIGLAHRVAPAAQAEAAAVELAEQASQGPIEAMRGLKGMFRDLEHSAERIALENALLLDFQRHGAGLPRRG